MGFYFTVKLFYLTKVINYRSFHRSCKFFLYSSVLKICECSVYDFVVIFLISTLKSVCFRYQLIGILYPVFKGSFFFIVCFLVFHITPCVRPCVRDTTLDTHLKFNSLPPSCWSADHLYISVQLTCHVIELTMA